MGEIGFNKLLLILVVALLLFGSRRLPEIGASLGKGLREFKRSLSDADGYWGSPHDPGSAEAGPFEDQPPSKPPPTTQEPKRLSR